MAGSSSAQMHRGAHVLAAAASGVAGFILSCGADPDRVVGEAGLDGRLFEDARAPLPLDRYVLMMENAARQSGNAHFGLRFGQQFQPEQLGLIGELALAAPNIGAGLTAFATHFALHQQNTEVLLVQDGPMLRLEYRILDAAIWSRRQDAELTMGMFANLLRRMQGLHVSFEEIWFEHPVPEQAHAHKAAFGAPVCFNAPTNAICFRPDSLARPMAGYDPVRFIELAAALRRIGGNCDTVDLLSRTLSEIRRALADGPPTINQVAERLGLPRWTLQRRLGEHGVTYSGCVDQVRSQLTRAYLSEPHLSVSTIADLLGYSEVSAFSRACTRLLGASPEAVRLRLLGGITRRMATRRRTRPPRTARPGT